MARDSWLYGNDKKTKKFVAKSAGRMELNSPASDVNFRMLTGAYKSDGPRITNWGGRDDSFAVNVSKAAPDFPASRQLKDPFEGLYSQGIALEPPLPPDRLLNLTEENTLHSGCLMAKAFDSCGRGWGFEPRDGKKGNKDLMKSELPEKLKMGMEVLTPEMTFGEYLYQAAWEMDAIGWGVWETVRQTAQLTPGKYAPIGAIYPIPAFTVRATIDPRRWVQIRAGRVRFFKKFGAQCEINSETGQVYDWKNPAEMSALDGLDRELWASEFIVFKSYTPRSLWYGIPRWISAVPTIAELTAIREFNVSWFASGGQTDYLVHFKATDGETAKKLRDDARQQMQENAGRGHTHLLTWGTEDTEVTAQKLGELLREGHFRFRRGDLAKEVLIAHNVPPYRIGWAEQGSLGGSTADEMLGAYKYGAIQPIQAIIEDRLENTLFNKDLGGIDTGMFRLKLTELQLDDMTKELDACIKKVENAIMTPNEAREELGMDPIEDEEATNQPSVTGDDDPYADPNAVEDPYAEPAAKAFGQATPDPTAAEAEIDPTAPEGANPMQPKKPASQAEAMNKFYFKGQELGKEPPAPPSHVMGPDGKPQPNPFAPKPTGPDGNPMSPDGSPAPAPGEKPVDKAMDLIKEFGNTLRDSLRGEGTAAANEPVSVSPPSERPSRRSRRQSTKI